MVGIQWFERVWLPLQHSSRWTSSQPENPTVSYCQTLAARLTKQLQNNEDSAN